MLPCFDRVLKMLRPPGPGAGLGIGCWIGVGNGFQTGCWTGFALGHHPPIWLLIATFPGLLLALILLVHPWRRRPELLILTWPELRLAEMSFERQLPIALFMPT